VLEQITGSGIQNYSIFLRDEYLFAYFEYVGDDFERSMQAMAEDPETQRWWELTDPCQEPLRTAASGERWAGMREVFHHD
jgi:L-rhamnose mutarotase